MRLLLGAPSVQLGVSAVLRRPLLPTLSQPAVPHSSSSGLNLEARGSFLGPSALLSCDLWLPWLRSGTGAAGVSARPLRGVVNDGFVWSSMVMWHSVLCPGPLCRDLHRHTQTPPLSARGPGALAYSLWGRSPALHPGTSGMVTVKPRGLTPSTEVKAWPGSTPRPPQQPGRASIPQRLRSSGPATQGLVSFQSPPPQPQNGDWRPLPKQMPSRK